MHLVSRIIDFYVQGFKSMTIGRVLWLIIIVKLIIMFGILKVFFFRDYLKEQSGNKSDYPGIVIESMNNNSKVNL